jgi:hypothetical protein
MVRKLKFWLPKSQSQLDALQTQNFEIQVVLKGSNLREVFEVYCLGPKNRFSWHENILIVFRR